MHPFLNALQNVHSDITLQKQMSWSSKHTLIDYILYALIILLHQNSVKCRAGFEEVNIETIKFYKLFSK